MSVPDPVGPATRLPADAAARVLRRAAAGAGVDGDLTVADLLDVARELEIPAEAVARALVEEALSGPPRAPGWSRRFAGPAAAEVVRVWAAPPPAALVEAWMGRGHCMRPARRHGDVVVWEPAPGLAGRARRAVLAAAGEAELADLPSVTTRCVGYERLSGVRVAADVGDPAAATVAAGVLAGAGVAGAAALAVALTPVALLAAPAGAVLGAMLLARRRRRVAAVTARLERMVDAVERGEAPRGVLGGVAARLRGG